MLSSTRPTRSYKKTFQRTESIPIEAQTFFTDVPRSEHGPDLESKCGEICLRSVR